MIPAEGSSLAASHALLAHGTADSFLEFVKQGQVLRSQALGEVGLNCIVQERLSKTLVFGDAKLAVRDGRQSPIANSAFCFREGSKYEGWRPWTCGISTANQKDFTCSGELHAC